MLAQDVTTSAAAVAGVPPGYYSRPPSQPRVVESAGNASLRQQQTASMLAEPPSAVQRLADSARQFAEILETTGNVFVASSVSGFRSARVDVYA